MARSESTVVVIALIGNLVITVSKFGAAVLTGSAAMASEGVHSLADTTNELLLLYGLHRANAPPDRRHPFGHGREAYFWSFIVALADPHRRRERVVLSGREPAAATRIALSHIAAIYVVLAISFVFEGISWLSALSAHPHAEGLARLLRRRSASSKDPGVFTVLLEDSAALLGLIARFTGTALDALHRDAGVRCRRVDRDRAAALRDVVPARARDEGAPDRRACASRIAARDPDHRRAGGMHRAHERRRHRAARPGSGVRRAQHGVQDSLTTVEIEAYVERVEATIRERHPEVVALYVKPQTHEVWEAKRRNLESAD